MSWSATHYWEPNTTTKKSFARRFEIFFRGGQHFQPPWLMPGLTEAVIFLLTEAVILYGSPPKI
jgi:hypothetical protein